MFSKVVCVNQNATMVSIKIRIQYANLVTKHARHVILNSLQIAVHVMKDGT